MTAFRLGIQLAVTRGARLRTVLLVLAAALAALVLLTTLTAGRFELDHAISYRAEMPRIVAAIIAAVALPCLTLLATTARLSASLRDRRLANLRLIGLTPGQTRLVAAAETGVAAALGAMLGVLAFWCVRPLLLDHPLGGRAWDASFTPPAYDQAGVLVVVPLAVVAAGLLPGRTATRDPLALTRRADRTPPGLWRLAPLGLGAALCAVVVAQGHRQSFDDTKSQIAMFFAGTALLALGLVLVLPVLVRLITRLLADRPLGPAARVAVRRLEAQPAAVARIIGALLIGLFLVTGARYVVTAFESTSQYVEAARSVEVEQRIASQESAQDAPATLAALAGAPGVRRVVDVPQLHSAGRSYLEAIVATCADLARISDRVTGCRDGRPMWLGSGPYDDLPATVSWVAGDEDGAVVATLPSAMAAMGNDDAWQLLSPLTADVVIPPSLVPDLPPTTTHEILITGPPGRHLADQLPIDGYASAADLEEYDFVASMRAVVWTVAGVVLGVGLLALGIATIDRTIARRKEVVGLQLVGLDPRTLRRAQAVETGLPVTVGAVLAIALGALAGATFLTLDDSLGMPWRQTWLLMAAAVAGCALVTAVATATSAPRVRPEEIRAE